MLLKLGLYRSHMVSFLPALLVLYLPAASAFLSAVVAQLSYAVAIAYKRSEPDGKMEVGVRAAQQSDGMNGNRW